MARVPAQAKDAGVALVDHFRPFDPARRGRIRIADFHRALSDARCFRGLSFAEQVPCSMTRVLEPRSAPSVSVSTLCM